MGTKLIIKNADFSKASISNGLIDLGYFLVGGFDTINKTHSCKQYPDFSSKELNLRIKYGFNNFKKYAIKGLTIDYSNLPEKYDLGITTFSNTVDHNNNYYDAFTNEYVILDTGWLREAYINKSANKSEIYDPDTKKITLIFTKDSRGIRFQSTIKKSDNSQFKSREEFDEIKDFINNNYHFIYI